MAYRLTGSRSALVSDSAGTTSLASQQDSLEAVLKVTYVRFGLASLMLVNAIVALLAPGDHQLLITNNIVGAALPTAVVQLSVLLVAANDLALCAALAMSWRPTFVLRWMALWFFAISMLKLLSFL